MREKTFTAVCVLSLALGVGANTVIFSFADSVLLRPPAVQDPGSLVRIFTTSRSAPLGATSYADLQSIGAQASTLSAVMAYSHMPVGLELQPDAPAQVRLAALVTSNYFEVVGVPLLSGRWFRSDEPTKVVVISNKLWRSQFGGDPRVIGARLNINSRPFTIIGVSSPNFTGLTAICTRTCISRSRAGPTSRQTAALN